MGFSACCMLEIYMHNFTKKKRKHAWNIYAHFYEKKENMLEICTFLRKIKLAWNLHFVATKYVNLWFVQVIVVENSTDEEDEETKALNPLPIVWNQRRDKNGFKISYILVCKIKT